MIFTWNSKSKRWVSEKGSKLTTSELVEMCHSKPFSYVRMDNTTCEVRS